VRAQWVILGAFVALALAPNASASDAWLPHPADATWTYKWSDTTYATTPTLEQVTVKSQTGAAYVLAWTTDGLDNPADAVGSAGTMSFQETNAGIVNTDWTSTPPPPTFPVLCVQAAGCGNALSSTLYNVIWGSRQPVLAEPLQQGLTWTGAGGAGNDVTSTSSYLGREKVVVPAFPDGVMAAKVQSTITQAGALGDPYGSGTRTIWWVYGVGPVKIEFDHKGGASAPVTTAELQSTNQTPLLLPTDVDFFPLRKTSTLSFRWTNSRYMKKPEVDTYDIDAVVNGTARLTLKSATGPIRAAGSYGFSKRVDGITNLWGDTSSVTKVKFPKLGPFGAPAARRNHFVTALDLLTFGLNPVLTPYPKVGDKWSTKRSSDDYRTFGVDGTTRVVKMQTVHVPAGTFRALVVTSTLRQNGFAFGSGTRTCWFAAGVGLVKLVFTHRDGSVSTVVRLK
jgi:hypothetical protein